MKIPAGNKALLVLCTLLICGALIFFAIRRPAFAPPAPALAMVEDFALLDQNGKLMELSRQSGATAVLLVSYAIGCPIVRKMLPRLEELRKQYEPQGVRIFLIDANLQDTRAALLEEARQFDIKVPLLIDDTQEVLRGMNVKRTGELLLIDPKSKALVFRGPLDDRSNYQITKKDSKQNFTETALTQFLAGKSVIPSEVPALGCAIQYEPLPSANYSQHVKPIFDSKCARCHVDAGVPPTNMSSYRELRGWGEMLREVIRTERMPPWEADEFVCAGSKAIALTAQEKRVIYGWVSGGYAEGPATAPSPAKPAPSPIRRDISLSMKEPVSLPADNKKAWHFEELLANAPEDIWVSGFQFEISNRPVLNHVQFFITPGPMDLSNQSFPPYWDKPGMLYNLVYGALTENWPVRFHPGFAFKIPKGYYVYLENHYNLTGKPEQEFVKVHLERYSGKNPPKEWKLAHFNTSQKIQIPAGVESKWITVEGKIEKPVKVAALNFHAHLRGKSGKIFVTDKSGQEKLVCQASRLLADKLQVIQFKEPFLLEAGSRLRAEIEYDNSATNPNRVDFSKEVLGGNDEEREEMARFHLWVFEP